jgi:hypothetical protein
MRAWVQLSVVLASVVLMTPGMTAPPPPKPPERKIVVAFVHDADEKLAGEFKKLLDGEGFSVELVAQSGAAKTDFSKFGLVMIGHDTKEAGWKDVAATVEKSGKPVLGLGEGGFWFFGHRGLKLGIGDPHGWHGVDTAVVPVDASKSPLWTATAQSDKPVKLYEKTRHVGIYLPTPPADAVLLGREEVSPKHYPLVRQGDRFVLWGFTAGPADMTADGRKVFVATCRYTADLSRSNAK